jgi:hypothetical protein
VEVAIVLADRAERRGPQRADEVVDERAERRAGLGGADRHRECDPRRVEASGHRDGRAAGGAGGQAVVDQDDHPAAQPQRRPPGPVARLPTPYLRRLPYRDLHDLFRLQPVGDLGVEHPHAARPDRAERDFRRPRHAELAHDQDIQRYAEPRADHRRDGHAAPHQPKDDRVRPPGVRPHPVGERRTRVGAIAVGRGHTSGVRARGR